MRLHDLKVPAGSRRNPKRKGRGIAAGQGKTAGRGHNGQKSRSGGKTRPGFEGGQMPLQQRLPKRGFRNIFKKEYNIINIETLNSFEDETVVTPHLLKDAGIIKNFKDGVKVLGKGELEKKLVVKVHSFSKTAEEKINNAGGKAEVV